MFQEEEQYLNQAGFPDQAYQVKSSQAKLYPYNCIGMIYFLRDKDPMMGTGFLIASDLVLTVAHNLYEKGKISTNIVFYPGINGAFNDANGYEAKDFRMPAQYKTKQSAKYDSALLKLKNKVHRQKYIDIGVDYVSQKEDIGVLGYRAERTKYGKDASSILFSQWKSNVHEVNKQMLKHKLSTFGGNSGGPILVKRKNQCIAIAIHKGYSPKSKQNGARLITKEVLIDLLKWERQMSPSQMSFNFMVASRQTMDTNKRDQWFNSISKRIQAAIQEYQGSKLLNKKDQQSFKDANIKSKYRINGLAMLFRSYKKNQRIKTQLHSL